MNNPATRQCRTNNSGNVFLRCLGIEKYNTINFLKHFLLIGVKPLFEQKLVLSGSFAESFERPSPFWGLCQALAVALAPWVAFQRLSLGWVASYGLFFGALATL